MRAGRLAASIEVATASTMPVAMAHQGRFSGSTRCAVSVSSDGTYANQAPRPITAPMTTAARPMTAPPATMTRRTLRAAAPSAVSMPSARSRRCAITVNPATDTRPMKIMPSTVTASTTMAGLMTPELRVCEASSTPAFAGRPLKGCVRPPAAADGGALSRIVTCVGAVTWPGATSANSSLRSVGFSTMPVTRHAVPPSSQVPPMCAS
jgi:hypothetical protein